LKVLTVSSSFLAISNRGDRAGSQKGVDNISN